MFKLFSSVIKEYRLLIRDRPGLALMFIMPVILVVVITSVQNSTFEMVNDNKLTLMIINNDSGNVSKEFIAAIDKVGMFNSIHGKNIGTESVSRMMNDNDALALLVIPKHFSSQLDEKTKTITAKALSDFGLESDTAKSNYAILDSLELFFHPVLQQTYRQSVSGALQSVLQLIENKLMVQSLYASINENEMMSDLEKEFSENRIGLKERYALIGGSQIIPNATQHNVPAWTIFAMFFMVISLGGNMVKEKLSGSFIRLRALPSNYMVGLFAKQMVYLTIALLQVTVIFSIGKWLFPKMDLPPLIIPDAFFGLVVVTLISGWCAISYAMCIGVFANTQEQANGFGAISIVLFAAIGGIFVPPFAMPQTFKMITNFSPLHWCLESYYGLFLQDGNLKDILYSLLPLLALTMVFQILILTGLKKKNLL